MKRFGFFKDQCVQGGKVEEERKENERNSE